MGAHRCGLRAPTRPLPIEKQNAGRYDGAQVLKSGLGTGAAGTRIHLLQPSEPAGR